MNLWSVVVPQMGFDHEFLLDAILSSSAFHMSTLLSNDLKLVDIGHKYYGQAVAKHREALSSIDQSTADPLCLTSVMIMFQTFKIACQQAVQEPSFLPVEWFRILNGMRSLIKLSTTFMTSDGINILLQRMDYSSVEERELPDLIQLEDLSSLLSHTDKLCNEALDADANAGRQTFLNNLSQILAIASAGGSKVRVRHGLLGLAATSEERFLRLMEQEDVFSIIILYHYFVLLKWTGGHWWLQSSLVSGLNRLLSSIPSEYQWAVGSQGIVTSGTKHAQSA
jgi:Fungal specific transcription factor domain